MYSLTCMQVSPCGLDVSHLCIILYKIYSCTRSIIQNVYTFANKIYIHTYIDQCIFNFGRNEKNKKHTDIGIL